MRKKKKPYVWRLFLHYTKCLLWLLFPHEVKYNPEQEKKIAGVNLKDKKI